MEIYYAGETSFDSEEFEKMRYLRAMKFTKAEDSAKDSVASRMMCSLSAYVVTMARFANSPPVKEIAEMRVK